MNADLNLKFILELLSFSIAVLMAYPFVLSHIGRENNDEKKIKKYLPISLILFTIFIIVNITNILI
jgi:hypothetical protein